MIGPNPDHHDDHGEVMIGLCVLVVLAALLGMVFGGIVFGAEPAPAALTQRGEPEITRSGYGFGLTLEQDLELRRTHEPRGAPRRG